MTHEQFGVFAMAMKSYYPKEHILETKQQLEAWYRMLADIPYEICNQALMQWVSTERWSPTVADLRERATTIAYGEVKDWATAWQEIQDSIREYGYYRAKEGMDCLDDTTKQVIRQLGGYQHICISEKVDVLRANFRDLYTASAKKERIKKQMRLEASDELQNLQIPEQPNEHQSL